MDTITTEDARDLSWGDDAGDDDKPLTFCAAQDESEHRWYMRRLIVFKRFGSADLFGFYHDKPATEEQEGMDEFDADPVPVFPVSAREVTTTAYEKAA